MHICMDEIMMVMAGVPFIGFGVQWLRAKFSRKGPDECCDHPHSHQLGTLGELPETTHENTR